MHSGKSDNKNIHTSTLSELNEVENSLNNSSELNEVENRLNNSKDNSDCIKD
eukprot:Awhi_evm1s518